MRKTFIQHAFATLIVACISTSGLNAQTKPHSYNDDLGFTVGINVPMYKGIETDATMGITYGHFYYNGLGFRTGFQYTPSVADVNNSFGIPIAFAYRTGSRSNRDRLWSGINGAASSAYNNSYYEAKDAASNMFMSFLMNMISNIEFTAGITPGFIEGGSSSVETSWYSGNNWRKRWTERNRQISLTLDAGACLNYSIWRFDLKLMPAFHYNLTNNLIYHKTTGNTNTTGTIESTQPIRWFFTLSGGLAFRF